MPNFRELKMTEEQLQQTISILTIWDEDKKLKDLIIIEGISSEDDGNRKIVKVLLQVSGEIKYFTWNEFCQEIEMRVPFPGW